MLTVHDRSSIDFTATGLGVLDPHVVEARVTEELNGEYSLSFVYPADGPLAKHLVLEAVIAAPVPGTTGRQGFRIHEVSTTLDGLLQVTAFHVFYDLAGNFIADTYVVNKTAKAALDQLLAAATTPHRFTATSSDIATRASARVVRMPLAAALMDTGEDNTFASRWAGELTRDNWHIHHAARRGADRGVVIRDRKNLTGYESVIDLTSVVTRIVPVGYDGITLPELYVDSPKLSTYITPRIKVIRYPQVKAITDPERPREDEVPLDQAHALLRQAARAEFAKNHVDEPAASYSVSFVELASTEEYADFAQLETVLLGDTVTVRHADLGVALTARVVAYTYDPLAKSYVSVELGSVAAKFTSVTRTISSAVQAAEAASDLAGVALASADGKTTNHYGPTQPAAARLGDTWFKDSGETTEIWIYQVTDTGQPGWVALATDLNHAQVSAELAAARVEVEAAQADADAALVAGQQAAARIASLEGELTDTRTNVTTVQNDMAALRGDVDSLDATSIAHTQQMSTLSADLAAAEQSLSQAHSDITALDTQLEQATSQVTKATSDITAMEVDLRATSAKLAATTGDVAELERDLATTRQMLASTSEVATDARDRAQAAAMVAGMLEPGNLVWNPRFREDGLGWGRPAGGKKTVHASGGYRDAYVSYQWAGFSGDYRDNIYNGFNDSTRMIPTTVGRTYKISVRIRCAQTLSAGALKIFMYQGTQNTSPRIPANTWVEWETTSTITTDASYQAFTWLTITGMAVPVNVDVDFCEPYVVEAATEWLIIDGAVKADKLAAGSVDAAKIVAGAITTDKLAAGAVDASKIRAGTITAAQLAAGAVNASKIQAGTITSTQIAAGTIASRNISAGAINAGHIQAGAITATQLASGAVTALKLAAGAITGEKIAAGEISAHHLRITPGNLWPDPHFLDPSWGTRATTLFGKTNVLALVATGVQSGAYLQPAGQADRALTLEPGASYRISCWARFSGTAGIPYVDVYARYRDAGGVLRVAWVTRLPRTDAVSYKEGYTAATFTMPEAAATGECTLGFYIQASMPDGEVYLSEMTLVRAADGTLIVDGSITARAIAAGTITGDKIAAGTITATQVKAASITSDRLVIANGFITNAMIANAAITDAKISSLSASKITTGYLASARIAAGSITSDKLTIASGFITNAMIADAAITNAKIAGLDAGKITTGVLNAARIGARSITADKLATNAIQVGLAGWTSSIRISPTQIAWYSGSSLEGKITSAGMQFWYGTRYIGEMARRQKKDTAGVQGIVNQLAYRGDYVAWTYQTTSTGDYYTCLTLDPKGRFYGRAGIHLGADLRMNGYKVYTSDTRYISFVDTNYTGKGTFASISSSNGLAKIGFHTYDLLITTNGSYYNMSRVFDRLKDLMARVNELIRRLNYGWIVSISGSGSNITWSNYDNTGLSAMSTTIS